MSKAPPVPREQQSSKIFGDRSPSARGAQAKGDPMGWKADMNLNEQGQSANLRQNTTNVRRIP